MLRVFLVSLLIAIGYQAFWYLCRTLGFEWHTVWNLPGFLFVAGSMPWSLPAVNNIIELNHWVGHTARHILVLALVCIGFAINITGLFFCVTKIRNLVSSKFRQST
ncbi:hypothetical protein FIV04_19800 (plasmid) [Vibrio sp. THAF190c]|nr:hypothetical protein FIV04_19800 [Vibrio sp. THAF190c]